MDQTLNLHSALKKSKGEVIVVGAGLAGSECAWQLAKRGIPVTIIEQRPQKLSAAHKTALFGELVCSNSLKSTDPESAPGLLKSELDRLDSLILKSAVAAQVPAGQALAVDRDQFSKKITDTLRNHPKVDIVNAEVEHFEELMVSGPRGIRPVVIATGPLTGESFSKSLTQLIGEKLYFYDAIAPIIDGATINKGVAFLQNRHNRGALGEKSADEGDYLNCPLNEAEYRAFITALGAAEKMEFQEFEKAIYFQGCQPIEALLERGEKTLAFGPMKPVGLTDPRTGGQPYACLQLRKEDLEGRSWNMVGFQTKLKYPEQKKVFRLIPGLEEAEFFRFGSIHRNTYIHSPTLLDQGFRLKKFPVFSFAGQITGVEGYLESAAIGALVGCQMALRLGGVDDPPPPPATTALGALAAALFDGKVKNFQPMNIHWGLVPLLGIGERDADKKRKLVTRAQRNFDHWLALLGP